MDVLFQVAICYLTEGTEMRTNDELKGITRIDSKYELICMPISDQL